MQESSNLNLILKNYHENKLSHAFLVDTNSLEETLKEIKKIIAEILSDIPNVKNLIEKGNLLNLKIIYPDGQFIKKEQILNLKNDFKTIPIYSKYNIYIIMEAEKLNSSSSNTLLKFLEEPEDNILAFLITNNKQSILETIISRCQYYNHFIKIDLEEKQYFNILSDFLEMVHKDKNKALLYAKRKLNDEINDKNKCTIFFQEILSYYNDILIKQQINKGFIISQIALVNEMLYRLNYNVNIPLLLESFILKSEVLK